MRLNFSLLALFISFAASFSLFARENSLSNLEFFFDKSKKADGFYNSRDFIPIPKSGINIPYNQGNVWIKGRITSQDINDHQTHYLVLTSPLTGKITLYLMQEGGWKEQARSGSALSWRERDVSTYYGTFKVPVSFIQKGGEFLIKREGHHLLEAKILFLTEDEFRELENEKTYIFIFYGGAVFALLIYNMFLFFYGKENIYGIYVGFLIVVASAAATAVGAMDALFRGFIVPSEYLLLFSSAATSLSVVFTRHFIDFRTYLPRVDKFIKWLPLLPMSIFFIYLFLNSSAEVRATLGVVIDIIIPVVLLSLITCSIFAYRNGSPLAKFYLLSWGVLTSGVLFYLAGLHGLITVSAFSQAGILLGNLGEMLLLSLALAHRMALMETEKKEMELNVKDKERYKRLVRVLCHDIANPLSIITSYAQMIVKKKEVSPEKNHMMAEKIQKASFIIEELLIRVRNYESLDATKNLQLLPVYLKHVMSEAEFLLQEKLKEKDIQLEYDKKLFDCWVLAERSSLLNNVIINILTNAIKFSEPHSQISIDVKNSNNKVQISISDRGVGMDSDQLNEFNLSGQIESRSGTKGESGTGLGMGLVKSYMKMYKGDVQIASVSQAINAKECGTTVTLTLDRTE
ncbi:MAG: hypothetical protein COW00_03395 [Bdellovibrio sp. CG12_big_fil_rev_8_21_14_0_65_39_13]|nr:MAG: hypothetical protein COW00_03395 [Bdellovibrio sp. CG12_big_fil_rev_8_21_14_0_65_39_13]